MLLTIVLAAAARHASPRPITTAKYTHATRSCRLGDQSVGIRWSKSLATWDLCWDIDPGVGLRISDVRFSFRGGDPVVVIGGAALAQIDVPYDDGAHELADLPGFGVTTAHLRPRDCPRGRRLGTASAPDVLCSRFEPEPRVAWSDYDFGTGNHASTGGCWVIFTQTPADWYTYITQWRFCDDGSLEGSVGAGGVLAPGFHAGPPYGAAIGTRTAATSHYHNVFWRLQLSVDEAREVDTLQTTGSGLQRRTVASTLRQEAAFRTDDSRNVFEFTGRAQGHAFAYDIESHNDQPYRFDGPQHNYTNNDLYVTQEHPCEVTASANVHAGCATTVDAYVNGETVTNPVVWLQESFHHVPRDEDLPVMNEHWLGFRLEPRNLMPRNMATLD